MKKLDESRISNNYGVHKIENVAQLSLIYSVEYLSLVTYTCIWNTIRILCIIISRNLDSANHFCCK